MRDIIANIHFASKFWLLALPCIMMGIDIMTGLVYAWTSRTFDSSRMRTGLGKKFGEISYIVIGAVVTYAMMLPKYVIMSISAYIIFMELMSIMENCDKLGAPVPRAVRDVVNNVSHTLEDGTAKEIAEAVEDAKKVIE